MAESGDDDGVVVLLHGEASQSRQRKETQAARRVEALSLRLAGLSYEQIGERLHVTKEAVHDMLERSFQTIESRNVAAARELENTRLDRAQAAIWTDVLKGDLKAMGMFLRISAERSKLNGLYAPQQVQMALSVRQEMVTALDQLEALVLAGEVVPDVPPEPTVARPPEEP